MRQRRPAALVGAGRRAVRGIGHGSGLALGLLALAGCTDQTVTEPPRSATEELLVSAAVDRAAERLATALPARRLTRPLYLDPVNLDSPDGRYAVGAVREALLRHGVRVVDERRQATYVLELRSGALSIDENSVLVGVPSLSVPLIQGLSTPEIALFSEELHQGVVKLAATAFDPESGALVAASGPSYGFSHKAEWTALLVVSWTTSDLTVDELRPEPVPWD